MMRPLLLALALCFGFSLQLHAANDFNGRWVVDLKASDSPEPMLERLGVGWVQRKAACNARIESTYRFTPALLTVDSRATGYSRNEKIRLDGVPEKQTDDMTGPYTSVSRWDRSKNRITSVNTFQTKKGEAGTLTVIRELTDGGATLVLTQTLKIGGSSWVVRRLWRRA